MATSRSKRIVSRRPNTDSIAFVLSERGERARQNGEGSCGRVIIVSLKTLVVSCFAHESRGALVQKSALLPCFSARIVQFGTDMV
jgi:hypothetical protein